MTPCGTTWLQLMTEWCREKYRCNISVKFSWNIVILIYWFLKKDEWLLSVCRITNKTICKRGNIRFNTTKRQDDKAICKAIKKIPWIVNTAPVFLCYIVVCYQSIILWAKNTINDIYLFSSVMYFNNKNITSWHGNTFCITRPVCV